MNDVDCPYCGEEIEICHDDGHGLDEDRLHEDQCPHCDKRFVFSTFISVSHEAEKADCLNGSDHDYQPTSTYPPERRRLRCSVCGEEKPMPDAARAGQEPTA